MTECQFCYKPATYFYVEWLEDKPYIPWTASLCQQHKKDDDELCIKHSSPRFIKKFVTEDEFIVIKVLQL
jgi:hypothetical protein